MTEPQNKPKSYKDGRKKPPARKIDRTLDLDDPLEMAIRQTSVHNRKIQKRKQNFRYTLMGIGALFLCGIGYLLFVPFKGTMAYGICKVFLEMNVEYPTTLHLSTVEELGSSVRIWFTQVDSFGEYRYEPIQCFYKQDEKMGTILEKVTIRRREIDAQKVAEFNRTLPAVIAHPPDLTLPRALPDKLEKLKFDILPLLKPIL